MKVAVCFGGGRVDVDLSNATHVIVFCAPQFGVDFNLLLSSLSAAEKHLLLSQRLHVVLSQWLEDCIEQDKKLPEESYSLKPNNIQELVGESDKHELNLYKSPSSDKAEEQNIPFSNKDGTTSRRRATTDKPRLVTLPKKEPKTKRGRSRGTGTSRGKTVINQPRRVRARGGNKPAKIHDDESDGSDSSAKLTFQEESEVRAGNDASGGVIGKQSPIQENLMIQDPESSQKRKAIEEDLKEQSGHGSRVVEAHEIGSGSRNCAEEYEKPEQMTDPVQAMLMHMIPSLGNNMTRSEDHFIQDEKLPLECKKSTGMDPAFVDESSSLNPNPEPEKKRKVSYKNVAGELLKDW